ncbi:MAG: selenocysteine-specific translation elongation factor [Gemmataceae bacterium]|nr:selenocysteine-specific translation elongation factor [Gemmataceae bacterium]
MVKDLILGTAGHIDHGKTSLVKALTGIDCDRLPEEKARGITIDLGFAHLNLNGMRIGIVDVPGHERFVKNMLAGATGFDLAMLVIASDDSVMPQTREHLEILKLLGIRHGLIALTKSDLADKETLELVELEIQELVAGTFLEGAPIVKTSVPQKMGIEEIKTRLGEIGALIESREEKAHFRMPIDRSFVVQGFGAVATGTVYSGQIQEGQEVELLPEGKILRVRSIQSHDAGVKECAKGQRCAVNLAGIDHHEIRRGQELVEPGYIIPSRVISVRLHCSKELKKPIKHRLPIRLHLGTSEIAGTISLLENDALAPGQWGMAQLFLESPATATWHQPFVLRNSSATVTLGGGHVVQPVARKIRRRHTHSLEMLNNLSRQEPEFRVKTAAWFSGYEGLKATNMPQVTGLEAGELEKIIPQMIQKGELAEVFKGSSKAKILDSELLAALEEKITKGLTAFHAANPLLSTHERGKVISQLDFVEDDGLVQETVEAMLKRKSLTGDQRRIGLASFKPKLTNNQRKLLEKIHLAHREGRFTPPAMDEFTAQAGGQVAQIKELFDICVLEGKLILVQDGLYLDYDVEAEMRKTVRGSLAGGKGMTVAELRDLLKTTRKYAVPFCEYLDKTEVTRREGDLRFLHS